MAHTAESKLQSVVCMVKLDIIHQLCLPFPFTLSLCPFPSLFLLRVDLEVLRVKISL